MGEQTDQKDLTIKEIFQSKKFWLLYIMNFCTIFYGFFLINSYKVFGAIYIHDDMFLTFVGSVGCICGSLRFLWCFLLDH